MFKIVCLINAFDFAKKDNKSNITIHKFMCSLYIDEANQSKSMQTYSVGQRMLAKQKQQLQRNLSIAVLTVVRSHRILCESL